MTAEDEEHAIGKVKRAVQRQMSLAMYHESYTVVSSEAELDEFILHLLNEQ